MDVFEAAQALRAREVPFALATVVRRAPPVSARPGDKAVVTADGVLQGWIGGSCAHAAVVTTALRALADGAPRLLVLDPSPQTERRSGVDVFPMACHSGGTLEIYVEPFLPRPRLVLMGASPVAETLARLAAAVGYRVFVLDPVATRERFPDAGEIVADFTHASAFGGGGAGETFVLVTTMGHADEEALEAALAHAPRYVAVVASRRRFAEIRRTLVGRGVSAEALDRVKNPAGLDIGARLPEEIAASILAEIVRERRTPRLPLPDAGGRTGSALSRFATDPVCGMSVDREAPAAVSTRGGVAYFFCCEGCRTRFEADATGGALSA